MVNNNLDLTVEFIANLKNGEGEALSKDLTKGIKPINVRLFSEMTLNEGCGIGIHSHLEETELYYIISGEGVYDDNGEVFIVKAGDTCICKSGKSHSIKNEKSEDLKFIAIIILE